MSKVRADRYTNRADDGAPTFSQGVNVVGSGVSIGIGASVYSPANNQLVLGTDSTERVRIASNGNVGINSSIPNDKLTVYNYNIGNPTGITVRNTEATSTYSHARLRLESQNGAAYGEIWVDVANAGLRLGYNSSSTVKIDSTGNIVLLNGRGIDFSASSDGSATVDSELLDDYEEGTWTPVPEFGNATTGITGTFVGKYVLIGRQVTLWYNITFTSKGSATGDFRVDGIPFNQASISVNGSGFSYIHRLDAAQTNGQLYASVSISDMIFRWAGYGGGNTTNLTDADIRNDTALYGSVTYRIA